MTILITGAFGFVGTNLSAYLAEKKHELWALDVVDVSRQDAKALRGEGENAERSTLNVQCSNGEGSYARCYGWEELAKIPWQEVDAVVHLAGKAHDTRNTSDPQSYFDVNVGLTKKVLEAWKDGEETTKDTKSTEGDAVVVSRQDAKAQRGEIDNIPTFHDSNIPVKKFLLFSSVKAVSDRVEGMLTEEALPNPQTPYGQSKLEAEAVVRSFSGKSELGAISLGSALSSSLPETVKPAHSVMEPLNQASGRLNPVEPLNQAAGRLNPYILRPCMIHGPGNRGNLNLLYGAVRRGVPWPLGAFENRRSFASIGNVCAVVEGLLTGEVTPGVYQVADDEAISTNGLIGLMAETLGRKARVWRVPAGLIRCAARCGDLLRLPLNSERLKKLTESFVVSNAKIKAALGWARMPVSAKDGMRRTIMSFETTKGTKNTEE